MARRYSFTYRELVELGVNPKFTEDYLETRQSVTLVVSAVADLELDVIRIDEEIVDIGESLQETNALLAEQVTALEETNSQLGQAEGNITNLQDAVQQNNQSIQNNSTAIQQTNDAVTILEDRHYIDTPVANVNPLPALPSFRANVLDSDGNIVGFVPIYT